MRLKSLVHPQVCACLVAFCVWLNAGEVCAGETEDLRALAVAVKEARDERRWAEVLDLTRDLEARPGPGDENETERSIVAYLLLRSAGAFRIERGGAEEAISRTERSMEWAESYEAASYLLHRWFTAGQPDAVTEACVEWSKPEHIAAFVATYESWRDLGLREAEGEADVDAWLAQFRVAANQAGGVSRARACLVGTEKDLAEARRRLAGVVRGGSGAAQPATLFYARAYLGYIADRQGKREKAASWYGRALELEEESADPLFADRFADTRDRAREGTKRRVTWMRHLDGSPVLVAASEGREDEVRLLLDAGADVAAADEDGSTALHRAASGGALGGGAIAARRRCGRCRG